MASCTTSCSKSSWKFSRESSESRYHLLREISYNSWIFPTKRQSPYQVHKDNHVGSHKFAYDAICQCPGRNLRGCAAAVVAATDVGRSASLRFGFSGATAVGPIFWTWTEPACTPGGRRGLDGHLGRNPGAAHWHVYGAVVAQ